MQRFVGAPSLENLFCLLSLGIVEGPAVQQMRSTTELGTGSLQQHMYGTFERMSHKNCQNML